MPSSISSSNDRLPQGPWALTWLLTVVFAVALAAGIESYWRSQGQRAPMVVDDKDNWCLQRESLSNGEQRTVALLGMSRIQLGFATQVFYDRYPEYTLGNLCVEGLAPYAALRDLAGDEQFRGIVIIEITEHGVLKDLWENQQPYIDHFERSWRWDRRLVRQTANHIQSRLVMVNPSLSIRSVLTKAIEGEWPVPNYLVTHADRSRLADFAKADMGKLWMFLGDVILESRRGPQKPSAPPVDPEAAQQRWLDDARGFEQHIKTIQARGGQVVFVRYPTSGATSSTTEAAFPKPRYWDQFARQTSALALHHADVPSLRGFETPDWSHLGEADAYKFTAGLLDELEKKGLLTR